MVVLFIRRRNGLWRDLRLTLGYWEDTTQVTGVLRPHTFLSFFSEFVPENYRQSHISRKQILFPATNVISTQNLDDRLS